MVMDLSMELKRFDEEKSDLRALSHAQMLVPEVLREIVQRLVVALKPEQIFLFGSYAYGKPNKDSDVDLLIIISHSDEPSYRRARWAYRALRGILIPTDVIVITKEEMQRKRAVRSSLVSQVLREGQLLYEA